MASLPVVCQILPMIRHFPGVQKPPAHTPSPAAAVQVVAGITTMRFAAISAANAPVHNG